MNSRRPARCSLFGAGPLSPHPLGGARSAPRVPATGSRGALSRSSPKVHTHAVVRSALEPDGFLP
eukprot:6859215-Pyramimonas_sp.AAC.1